MSNEEPSGCLFAILRLFGFGGGGEATGAALPYRLRDDFLSPAELSFYKVLQLVVKDRATISTKVNLADLFFVLRSDGQQSYRNKIDRKHVDFLLCDLATMKPLAGIELDDSSHQRADRIERDQFVDSVFQTAGLPLLHFPVRQSYNVAELSAVLAPLLSPQARPLPPSHSASSCCDLRPAQLPQVRHANGSANCHQRGQHRENVLGLCQLPEMP